MSRPRFPALRPRPDRGRVYFSRTDQWERSLAVRLLEARGYVRVDSSPELEQYSVRAVGERMVVEWVSPAEYDDD